MTLRLEIADTSCKKNDKVYNPFSQTCLLVYASIYIIKH